MKVHDHKNKKAPQERISTHCAISERKTAGQTICNLDPYLHKETKHGGYKIVVDSTSLMGFMKSINFQEKLFN